MVGVRAFPFPEWPTNGKLMWCKWCGEPIPRVIDGKKSTQRMWHPWCWDECLLYTRLDSQYAHLVSRNGERCALCPEGAPKPMKWLRGEEVCDPQGVPPMPWDGERSGEAYWTALFAYREVNPYPRYCQVERVVALEVDHRVPLWSVADLPDEERRWYFGPDNLWLLCPTHHGLKTAREAAYRAEIKRFDKAQRPLPLILPPDGA